MIVAVDASVAIDLVLGAGSPAGDTLAAHLADGSIVAAPHLIDAEVGQGIRRLTMHGDVNDDEAETLITDYLDLPIKRYPHVGLLHRALDYRSNLTVYDGLYLALAEALDCPLLTGDLAHRNVPGSQANVEVHQPHREQHYHTKCAARPPRFSPASSTVQSRSIGWPSGTIPGRRHPLIGERHRRSRP
jgi:predicted nucleic acid-binding protein